ncbi:hypothetical protein [Thermomonospora amylolytica]|uniref:hypothetical protein n=1 Tax=Thermomonospora amylolytica TaxID=1411117 RepID=UPI001300597E|nr:hypothetical protein [Thermomonospora amylolytica]
MIYASGSRRDDCANCGEWLDGRQTQWCSERCRTESNRREARRKAGPRYCELCGNPLHYSNPGKRCRMGEDTVPGELCYEQQHAPYAARRAAEDARWDAVCICGINAGWDGVGRPRKYCSTKCRVRAHRARKLEASRDAAERE